MRIALVGAGSMGSLFGGLLARAGEDVWLVDKRADHMDAVRENGLRMSFPGGEWRVPVNATTDPSEPGPVDLIVFFVKSFDTLQAAQEAAPLMGSETLALSLQNGLGNAEKIIEGLGTDRVIAGVTRIGAKLVAPGHVEITETAANKGGGTSVGAWKAGTQRSDVERIARVLDQANILTDVLDDAEVFIWGKLANAASMASLTAITHSRVGNVMASADGLALMTAIIDEIVAVANAKGIGLDRDTTLGEATKIFVGIPEHSTSMAEDVAAGRRTEIDALNGAVVEEAEKLGIDVPVNRVIASLVRLIEQNYEIDRD